ncbi:MAG: alpha/beta hydrolase family protein [Limisphaerales bacterium]
MLLALLLFGALAWARGRDPFQRVWFKVKVPGQGKAECIAVLPKTSLKSKVQSPKSGRGRWPVVVYLHGSGGSLLGDGNELRQMAEMGLAAVGMEYEGKAESRKQKAEIERPGTGDAEEGTQDGFDEQFSALLEYLCRQPWADTNRMAWVGFSLGAQRVLAFALRHPERQPKLLVRLAGGWVPELRSKVQSLKSKVHIRESEGQSLSSAERGVRSAESGELPNRPSTLNSQPSTALLLVHGERDEVFPVSEAQRVAACLQTNGVPVELRILPGEGQDLGANRLLVFRVIGEQCLTRLAGPEALANYRSILSWQAQAKPLWLFWTPALAWGCLWLWSWRRGAGLCGCWWPRRRSADFQSAVSQICNLPSAPPSGATGADEKPAECNSAIRQIANLRYAKQLPGEPPALRWWEIGLRGLAAVLAVAAVAQTALHLVPPRLPIGERTLAIARKHLVAPKERSDFEFLAAKPFWPGKRLRTLLEHVELAHYNRELINWTLDEQTYQQFVLSPEIDPALDWDMNWRRPLWENFYPRIRREQGPEAAAEIVVRFLRERVTIAEGSGLPAAVSEIWQRQITNERGFEAVYVAALRSVGIPARLSDRKQAEFFADGKWQLAPRPLVEKWE